MLPICRNRIGNDACTPILSPSRTERFADEENVYLKPRFFSQIIFCFHFLLVWDLHRCLVQTEENLFGSKSMEPRH